MNGYYIPHNLAKVAKDVLKIHGSVFLNMGCRIQLILGYLQLIKHIFKICILTDFLPKKPNFAKKAFFSSAKEERRMSKNFERNFYILFLTIFSIFLGGSRNFSFHCYHLNISDQNNEKYLDIF